MLEDSYTIPMALDICEGRDPFLSSYSEEDMQFHLEKYFESKCLTEDSIWGVRGRLKSVQNHWCQQFCVCRYLDVDATSYVGDKT